MKDILIFRTDRIGDMLLYLPFINCLKRNYPTSKVSIVCSEKNFNYASNLQLFDQVYLYPKNFIQKIILFCKLFSKKDLIAVLDGKKRSIYFSILIPSKIKIIFSPSLFVKKIFFSLFSNSFYIDYNESIISYQKKALSFLELTIMEEDYLLKIKTSNKLDYKIPKSNNPILLFNFDEKWIWNNYIKTFENIEPSYEELISFIKEVVIKKKYTLLMSDGLVTCRLFEKLIYTSNKINEFVYEKIIDENYKIYLFRKIDIYDLSYLISCSSVILTCHGAPSHLAACSGKRIIDIIDGKDGFLVHKSCSDHFKRAISLPREKFSILFKKILDHL